MNELERLAGELSRLTDTSRRHRAEGAPTIKDIDRAAAILLAASKVDVAGLMELVAKVSNAAYVAGLQDANGEGCDATAQTLFEDELETALRMALATRELIVEHGWQHAIDNAMVSFGGISTQFKTPEDAVKWLLQLTGDYAIACVSTEQTLPTTPKEWVGLTDDEWVNIINADDAWDFYSKDEAVAAAVKLTEAKLKEKNT